MEILWILFYVMAPALLLSVTRRIKILQKLGVTAVVYLLGLLIGNLGILPDAVQKTQELTSGIVVLLSIPMLLFSTNLRTIRSVLGSSAKAMLLGIVSLMVMISTGYLIFSPYLHEGKKVAGMLTALYSGGTPNLASLKTALHVTTETYILVYSYDMFVGALYFMFVISFAKKIFRAVLPTQTNTQEPIPEQALQELTSVRQLVAGGAYKSSLQAALLALLILGLSFGVAQLFPKNYESVLLILAVTTLGLAASFVRRVRQLSTSFGLGTYFILVFSLVVSSMADLTNFHFVHLPLMGFVAYATLGSFLLHLLLAYIFRSDADTVLISSSALILSPPFVPVVAEAIRCRGLIVPGIFVGLLGYVLGNYLGVFIAMVL